MTQLDVTSPCKINLFLHINGKRDDGYHELQTVFQLLNYGDDMSFTTRADFAITISPEIDGVPLEDNLIWKAASALQAHTGCHQGIDIRLNKRVPMGGGLGGGSSNAATTLLALNRLWSTNLSIDELASIGKNLGADVPIFIRGTSAWAEGIGEQLTPMQLPEKWYLIIKPDCHIETSKIFSHKGLTRDTPKVKIAPAPEGYGDAFRNDCESLVRKLYQPVDEAISWLNNYSRAMLTGTGACVFASFESITQAEEVLEKLPKNLTGFVAQGINQSPVSKRLEQMT